MEERAAGATADAAAAAAARADELAQQLAAVRSKPTYLFLLKFPIG